MALYEGSASLRLKRVLTRNVWGVEIDETLFRSAIRQIEDKYGPLPELHNLHWGDFFETDFHFDMGDPSTDARDFTKCNQNSRHAGFVGTYGFTYVIGNPPFGGTIARHLQDSLDRTLGFRYGHKIKKETYAFFTVKSVDLLAPGGRLRFICSDTFLTIFTMKGLRHTLSREGSASVHRLGSFSSETSYPMVVLDWQKTGPSTQVIIHGQPVSLEDIRRTGNESWGLSADLVSYFRGQTIGDVMIATSGMTTGNNALFIREVEGSSISEPYEFSYERHPITLEAELKRARLGRISDKRTREIKHLEAEGATQQVLRPRLREQPIRINLPHSDYVPYNKASKSIIYQPTTHYIYWRNSGEALLTYKRTGNWYLRGVGGSRFFFREGLTWRLISSSIDIRYLPPGYILDSGAPCAFLRGGVDKDEMYFIMGWVLTQQCNRIMKQVINHTHNIQSKDFERLPYPFWVACDQKQSAVNLVREMVDEAIKENRTYNRTAPEISKLDAMYELDPQSLKVEVPENRDCGQMELQLDPI